MSHRVCQARSHERVAITTPVQSAAFGCWDQDTSSLLRVIMQAGKVPEPVLSNLTAQVLQGLLYLHKSRHTVSHQWVN